MLVETKTSLSRLVVNVPVARQHQLILYNLIPHTTFDAQDAPPSITLSVIVQMPEVSAPRTAAT